MPNIEKQTNLLVKHYLLKADFVTVISFKVQKDLAQFTNIKTKVIYNPRRDVYHDSKIKKLSKLRIVHSIMFLSLSLYFSSGLTGNKLHGLVESYLPPSKVDNWIQSLDEALILSNKLNTPKIFE